MEVDQLEESGNYSGECNGLLDHLNKEAATTESQDSDYLDKPSSEDQQQVDDAETKDNEPQEIPMAGEWVEQSIETEQTENHDPESYANSESLVEGAEQTLVEKQEDEIEITQPSSLLGHLNGNLTAVGKQKEQGTARANDGRQ
ncbi:hypothetical protein Ancab_018220 [Ancistrocladus abbreviatus]